MKESELRNIEGLNLPTELPCTQAIITRVERHLAEQRSIQSRLAPDDPFYKRNAAEYKLKIAIIEGALEELRQPNFQFEPEPTPIPPISIPQLPSLPEFPSQKPKNNFPTQNSAPTESNIAPQPHPSTAERSRTEFKQSPAEFPRSFAESEQSPMESDSLPKTPTPPITLVPTPRKPFSLYDLYAEPKLDADDMKELSICFAEHKGARSPLDQLVPEIQTAILALLSEHSAWMVAQLLAQPTPIGLGLKTNDASLNKFRARHKDRHQRAAREQRLTEIQNIVIENQGDTFKTTVHLLEGRLLKALSQDDTKPDDLQRITRSLATLRRQALAEGHPIKPYLPKPTPPKPTPDYEL